MVSFHESDERISQFRGFFNASLQKSAQQTGNTKLLLSQQEIQEDSRGDDQHDKPVIFQEVPAEW